MELSPSDVCSQMPCQLDWCQLESNAWAFSSRKYKDELGYQRTIHPIMCESVVNIKLIFQFLLSTSKSFESYLLHTAAASVLSMFPTEKWRIQSVMEKMSTSNVSLVQFWAPIKVNGSTFMSTTDQTFGFYNELDKRLSSYRKLCLDTLIPIDDYIESLFGPIERVYTRCLPEYNPDVRSYSAAEFPLLETAIRLGIHSYYAVPVFNNYDQQYRGVLEIVSTQPSLHLSDLITPPVDDRLDEIKNGLYEILERDSLPFAQIWVPYSPSVSLKVLYCAAASIYERSSSMCHEFEHISEACFIESGTALVGRAFASQGSCFCKDVTLLSIKEYPLVPSAQKVRFTQSFAICLQSKCANNSVYVVEYFLPPNKMSARDTRTYINMLISTTKERLPGFIVAPGKELGQRILVEVVKVSPSDEFDSFEIDQSLPSVQSLQDGGGTTEIGRLLSVQFLQDVGETTEIDSFCQQSNNVVAAAALLVPFLFIRQA
ncbi:protein NLP7-like [Solanum stenotomum]|uniref:protein NLP7-like n=1 Tax=Solanum stenotomum TaxID=172797 RepID=UPI0020D149ED|nr:protein NLP7-like [Solanum stenotomum]